jgi:hypothetical protein
MKWLKVKALTSSPSTTKINKKTVSLELFPRVGFELDPPGPCLPSS